MKKNTFCFALLLGLTTCTTAAMEKVRHLSKSFIHYCKHSVFNTKVKKWTGIITASTATALYINNKLNKLDIQKEIQKCIKNESFYFKNFYKAIKRNPKYATACMLKNFKDLANAPAGKGLISMIVEADPSSLDSLIKAAYKDIDSINETKDGVDFLYELLQEEIGKKQNIKKIGARFLSIAVKKFTKLAGTDEGMNYLISIVEDNSEEFADLVKNNIDTVLTTSRGFRLTSAILRYNPKSVDWMSTYALENFTKLYASNLTFLSEVISLCKDEDAFKFKKIMGDYALEKGFQSKQIQTEWGYDWYKSMDVNETLRDALRVRIEKIERERVIQQLIFENKRVIEIYENALMNNKPKSQNN